LLLLPQIIFCQGNILDSTYTFKEGAVKTVNALSIITKQTGYNFTYDSRLVDDEKRTLFNFKDTKLEVILENILSNDSLNFSVIGNYIIISRPEKALTHNNDSLNKPEINYITGIIVDAETSEPLPFATLGLKNKGKGTVSNSNGEFGLNIAPEEIPDTFIVSYLGYMGREIPIKQALRDELTISMQKEFIPIPGIIIRNQIPQEIISKARLAVHRNYGNTPAHLTGFYREGVLEKKELQNYSEAVLMIYKTPYSGSLLSDQIKIFKSRKIENTDLIDTLSVRLKAGLRTCLQLDGAKNMFDFMASETMDDYRYRMTDIVTYDEDAAFVIEFEQHEDIELPLFKGSVYINTSDFAILHAEFEINPKLIDKVKDSFISSSTRKFNTRPVAVKYIVNYRKINDRYFLSHVRGDLTFISKLKRKLFNTQFNVFFELAITDVSLDNVKRYEREEIAPLHSIFSRTITNYDPAFWGNQDFLRPEDNLLQALKDMNVKLHEFSESNP
jgi:hypothetical protein